MQRQTLVHQQRIVMDAAKQTIQSGNFLMLEMKAILVVKNLIAAITASL